MQLARSMLQRSSDGDGYQPPQGTPDWPGASVEGAGRWITLLNEYAVKPGHV